MSADFFTPFIKVDYGVVIDLETLWVEMNELFKYE